MTRRGLLVLNAGSSSLKFQVFELGGPALEMTMRGQVEGIGIHPHVSVRDRTGEPIEDRSLDAGALADTGGALQWLSSWLEQRQDGASLVAVGHRVVHGGARFGLPVRIDASVLAELERLSPLAPLHQPHNLSPIRDLLRDRPLLPQVACFDTAFHRTQPLEAECFALPRHFHDEGIRRYGFHGLSYEYVSRRLREVAPELAAGRVIAAHLGNGVSMCAMVGGESRATTMGFTALDGCPMGTRCGSLDPGVVLHLARERAMSLDAIEDLLYRQSGLLGLSGVSSDMRELLASSAEAAGFAIEYFTYRLAREVGSLAAAIGGLDALVFTAGIGENSPQIRQRICERLEWMGLVIDASANAAGADRFEQSGSRIAALRIATDEERMIAEHTCKVLGLG